MKPDLVGEVKARTSIPSAGMCVSSFRQARDKGATPIVSTTTTRYLWTNPNAQFNGENGSLISKNENYDPR